jgi:hypothetical protein
MEEVQQIVDKAALEVEAQLFHEIKRKPFNCEDSLKALAALTKIKDRIDARIADTTST